MQEEEISQEETIDIKALILKYAQYWYYFILSILFFGCIAFLNNRYTVPEYSVSTTLLIRDDNNTQLGAENLLEGLELFSGKKNLKNEIVILKSYSLSEKVIKELNLGISYYQHGFLQTNELFGNSPFNIRVDSSHLQLTGVNFKLTPVNNEKFILSVVADNQYPYTILSKNIEKSLTANINIEREYAFNSLIETEFYAFTVNKSIHFNLEQIIGSEKYFSFKLHQIDKLANNLIEKVIINPINKETSILKLSIKERTPRRSIHILNKITEIYIRSGLDEKNLMAINTIHFIDEQLAIIKDSLSGIERKLELFKTKHPNLEIVDKEYGTYFQKQKLDNSLSEQSVNIKYYKSLLSYLKNDKNTNSIVSPTSMGISNPELNSLINQLLQLYAKKGELQLTTTGKNPTYIAVLSQINHTKKTIIENVNNLISSASIYEVDLIDRITTFDKKINKLPEAEKDYLILRRKYEYNEQTAIYLQQKRYEASLAKAGTESDHKVIDLARLDSEKPISPRKSLAYFIALLFGILIPITFISLRDFFSDTIKSKSDLLNSTNIPILGLVGHSDNAKSLVVPNASKSIIAESFRALRTNIQYLAADKKKKVITVTSSIGGEGKTFTTMNLAAIFALSGHKTILIGGDLRKPKLHKDFKVNTSKGLSSYLINKSDLAEVIEKTEIDTLNVIASGPTPPNPAELLDSKKMINLIMELNKTYDYVIIDTPPIGLVTDGVILMRNADVNLYVVRHNYSKTSALNVINNLYRQKQVENIHIIINDFKHTSSGYGYGYGYGSSGYGYYENEED
ncbi:MAG: polysaccharide biosynthesis tyrosine autokinase [Flavobacteriales bacterium]|jgi:tyrosine-protein kinase Etk/Wzc|nr:polysaccharide biosynthesis tyrosine autokinase [Flavobacteriales bacterium]